MGAARRGLVVRLTKEGPGWGRGLLGASRRGPGWPRGANIQGNAEQAAGDAEQAADDAEQT